MKLSISCPTCQKEVQWQNNVHRPFCSERCKLIDLGAWAHEDYKVPTEELPLNDYPPVKDFEPD